MRIRTIIAVVLCSFTCATSFVAATTDDTPDGNANYCPNLSLTLKRGMRDANTGGQVSELQYFLASFFDLDEQDVVSGYFGKATQRYVTQFQSTYGLPAYGITGTLTRAKIQEVCRGQSTPQNPTPLPTNPTPTLRPDLKVLIAPGQTYNMNDTLTFPVQYSNANVGSWICVSLTKDNTNLFSFPENRRECDRINAPSGVLTVSGKLGMVTNQMTAGQYWAQAEIYYSPIGRWDGLYPLNKVQSVPFTLTQGTTPTGTLYLESLFAISGLQPRASDGTPIFKLDEHIPLKGYVTNMPLNTQLNFESQYNDPSTGWRSSSKFTYMNHASLWNRSTAPWSYSLFTFLASNNEPTGKYRMHAYIQQCPTQGCDQNPDFPGYGPTPVLFTAPWQEFTLGTTASQTLGNLTFYGVNSIALGNQNNVTRDAAQGICAAAAQGGQNGGCYWNNERITPPYLKDGSPMIQIKTPSPNVTVSRATPTTITFTDPSASGQSLPSYNIYLWVYNQGGQYIERVYESSSTGSRNRNSDGSISINWDPDKVETVTNGAGAIVPLPSDVTRFYLSVVNTDSGVYGNSSAYIFLSPSQSSGATVSSSSNQPANSLAPQRTIDVPFTRFTISAGTQPLSLNGFNVALNGTGTGAAFKGIAVRDETRSLTTPYTTRVDDMVTSVFYTSPLTIPAGESHTFLIMGKMVDDLSSLSGRTVSLALQNVAVTSGAVMGTLPITGATHTLNSTLDACNPIFGYRCDPASTTKPTCNVYVQTKLGTSVFNTDSDAGPEITKGESVGIWWNSANATTARWLNAASADTQQPNPITNTSYVNGQHLGITFTGPGGSTTCSFTIYDRVPDTPVPTNNSARIISPVANSLVYLDTPIAVTWEGTSTHKAYANVVIYKKVNGSWVEHQGGMWGNYGSTGADTLGPGTFQQTIRNSFSSNPYLSYPYPVGEYGLQIRMMTYGCGGPDCSPPTPSYILATSDIVPVRVTTPLGMSGASQTASVGSYMNTLESFKTWWNTSN